MQITDVRIKLSDNPAEKVKAWTSVEIDRQLAIRDIKVIDAGDGLFLAMPCRKTTDRCQQCKGKNQNTARWCNWCGKQLAENRVHIRPDGKPDLWHDIAFPIDQALRTLMTDAVLDEYERIADIAEGYKDFAEDANPIQKIEARHGE